MICIVAMIESRATATQLRKVIENEWWLVLSGLLSIAFGGRKFAGHHHGVQPRPVIAPKGDVEFLCHGQPRLQYKRELSRVVSQCCGLVCNAVRAHQARARRTPLSIGTAAFASKLG
jgi:hypothetical protein